MSTMLHKVAAAIAAADLSDAPDDPTFDFYALTEEMADIYYDIARAAVEAMTPTGHVEEAGWQAVRSINPEIWMSLDEVGQVFTAMIQAALKEQA